MSESAFLPPGFASDHPVKTILTGAEKVNLLQFLYAIPWERLFRKGFMDTVTREVNTVRGS
jgi:hypothetical protein